MPVFGKDMLTLLFRQGKDYVLVRAWGDQGESFRFRASTDLNFPAERRRDHFDDTNINRGEAPGWELYNTHSALPCVAGYLSAGFTSDGRRLDGEKVA